MGAPTTIGVTPMRVEGPVVDALQSAFADNWREATGEVLGAAYYPRPHPQRGEVTAQVVHSSPANGCCAMYAMFSLAISSARRSIHLTNPYFLPDERMTEAFLGPRGECSRRRADGKIDHNLVRLASRRNFGRMLRGGIEIFEYQAGLLHAKTMVVDGDGRRSAAPTWTIVIRAQRRAEPGRLRSRAAARLDTVFQDDLMPGGRLRILEETRFTRAARAVRHSDPRSAWRAAATAAGWPWSARPQTCSIR
jgi:cardiolipin synthase